MTDYQTIQESFWAGKFGDEYVGRNQGESCVEANTALFAKVFNRAKGVRSILEIGPNIGLNLRAIRNLLPAVDLSGVEINETAVRELRNWGEMKNIMHQSLLDYQPTEQFDFVFTKGVLIHLCPDLLPDVYQLLYKASFQYICVAEYYNPSPVSVPYRGHDDKLFKRDFAGEIMDLYPDLKLVDYGFCYHRDSDCPQDDITWFLLKKTGGNE